MELVRANQFPRQVERAAHFGIRNGGAIRQGIRAARYLYENRENIANTARSAARTAMRMVNRFRGASTSSRRFKPAPSFGGGGRGGFKRRTKFKSRKPRRGTYRKGKKRTYKRSGISRLVSQLWPLKSFKTHCLWRAETDATAFAGFTSMEVGNWNPVTVPYPAGQGPQSCFAAKPLSTNSSRDTANGGSINACVQTPFVDTGDEMQPLQKRYFSNQYLTLQVQNACNNVVHVTAYTCKWRRSEATATEMTLESKFSNALSVSTVASLHGVTPFMLPKFVSQVKIIKTQKRRLVPGEECYFSCYSPLKGTHTFESLTDEPVTPNWTRGILLVFYGAMVSDTVSHAKVSSGPAALNIKGTIKGSYRIISTEDRTTKFSNHQVGGVTEPEVNPMNYNNPQPYTE